jgi:hypothetical protein
MGGNQNQDEKSNQFHITLLPHMQISLVGLHDLGPLPLSNRLCNSMGLVRINLAQNGLKIPGD